MLPTSSGTNAGWSPFTLTLKRKRSLTSGCMRCNIVARSRRDRHFQWPRLNSHKSMGLVADIFTEDMLSKIRGSLAIGHTRYSTAGDSSLLNAQPIMVQSNKGVMALAHNGNLVNAQEIRSRSGKPGIDLSDQ